MANLGLVHSCRCLHARLWASPSPRGLSFGRTPGLFIHRSKSSTWTPDGQSMPASENTPELSASRLESTAAEASAESSSADTSIVAKLADAPAVQPPVDNVVPVEAPRATVPMDFLSLLRSTAKQPLKQPTTPVQDTLSAAKTEEEQASSAHPLPLKKSNAKPRKISPKELSETLANKDAPKEALVATQTAMEPSSSDAQPAIAAEAEPSLQEAAHTQPRVHQTEEGSLTAAKEPSAKIPDVPTPSAPPAPPAASFDLLGFLRASNIAKKAPSSPALNLSELAGKAVNAESPAPKHTSANIESHSPVSSNTAAPASEHTRTATDAAATQTIIAHAIPPTPGSLDILSVLRNAAAPSKPVAKSSPPPAVLNPPPAGPAAPAASTFDILSILRDASKDTKAKDSTSSPSATTMKSDAPAADAVPKVNKKKPHIPRRLMKKETKAAPALAMSPAALADVLSVPVERVMDVVSGLAAAPMKKGDALTPELCELVILEMGYDTAAVEERLETQKTNKDVVRRLLPTDFSVWPSRPPVVTILGHVDHGKTTLLDSLREASVAAGEAGGITQHIGAFSGASVTDVIVLVVAADDGVQPQTLECIKIAKGAGVPIVVAVNKCDKPDANSDLLRYGLQLEEFGGDVQVVEISALKKKNLPALLEAILLAAEMKDLRADREGPAEAIVIEAKTEKGRGHVVTALVRVGNLKPGAVVVSGTTFAKIRSLVSEGGIAVKSVYPSEPVEITGWKELPSVGDDILQVESESQARDAVSVRQAKLTKQRESVERVEQDQKRVEHEKELQKAAVAARSKTVLKEDAGEQPPAEAAIPMLNVLLKGDVAGSVEALAAALVGLANHRVALSVVREGVGPVTEVDIEFARVCNADILAFNLSIPPSIAKMAAQHKVKIISHNLCDLLPPKQVTVVQGRAEVLQVFQLTGQRKAAVAGCKVQSGQLARKDGFRVLRNGEVIFEGRLSALKHFKEDVQTIANGNECGLSFEGYDDVAVGDVIECVQIRSERASLEDN